MVSSIQEYNRREDALTKSFVEGVKAFEKGYPRPIVESPERYGWLAAQEMKKVYLQRLEECKQLMMPFDLDLYLEKQIPIPTDTKGRSTLSQACANEERSLLIQIEALMERTSSPGCPEAKRLDVRLKKVRAVKNAIGNGNKVQFLPMHSERA